jgi:hypothetical protein
LGVPFAEIYESPALAIAILPGLADSHSGLRRAPDMTITNQNDSFPPNLTMPPAVYRHVTLLLLTLPDSGGPTLPIRLRIARRRTVGFAGARRPLRRDFRPLPCSRRGYPHEIVKEC